MSLNNYATVQTLTRQHHQELLAAAANDRLARIVLSGRRPWWRRLSRGRSAKRAVVAAAPGACAASVPHPCGAGG